MEPRTRINSLTRQIEHQYHSRFVIELLQNAHDAVKAQPGRGLGRIGLPPSHH